MSSQDFFSKLNATVESNDSLLCVGLDPTPQGTPARFRGQNEPITRSLLRWNRAIIENTHELACAYKPNIAFYEALGLPGLEMLRETLNSIPAHIPILLDAKRGDIDSTAKAYAQACFEVWQADAVTLSPYLGKDSVQPFLDHSEKGIFVLCHTSNPGAVDFQHLEISDWRTLDRTGNAPLYIHVARTATQWGENVGLVVGATYPDAMRHIREVAPQTWFLVPGIGAQEGALAETVAAGIRDDRRGLLINVGRGISQAGDFAAAARDFREQINRARTLRQHKGVDYGVDTVALQQNGGASTARAEAKDERAEDPFLADLTTRLVELGAVKFGSFTLASGIQSPIYIDLRLLVSEPPLLAQVAAAYAQQMTTITFDRLAGVPYAALPIGTAVSLHTGIPMIYPRKEAKAYGLGKDIEGNWEAGERILIVEDLITSGGSILKTAERLRDARMIVEDCIVLIDRAQGGAENLAAAGIRAHSVFNIYDMLRILEARQVITASMAQDVRAFLTESKAA